MRKEFTKPKRISVSRTMECDTSKLYDNLDVAIKYLQDIKKQHPSAQLEEWWYEYENMELRFNWSEMETDEEYNARCDEAFRIYQNAIKDEIKKKKVAELKRHKEKLEQKINEIERNIPKEEHIHNFQIYDEINPFEEGDEF